MAFVVCGLGGVEAYNAMHLKIIILKSHARTIGEEKAGRNNRSHRHSSQHLTCAVTSPCSFSPAHLTQNSLGHLARRI